MVMIQPNGPLGIDQLAKRGGVSIDTARYCDTVAMRRSSWGRYTSSATRKRSTQAKLLAVERRIAAFGGVRDGLAKLIRACPGHGRAADCPILRALSDEFET